MLDILLQSLLKCMNIVIKDDLDTLEHLRKTTNDETSLVSFDVINFDANLPQEYGIETIKSCLEKYPEVLPKRIN